MNRAILLGVVGGAIAVAAAGGGAAYVMTTKEPGAEERRAAIEAAERARFAREDEIHDVAVFSFLPQGRRDGGAQAVMVRLQLGGSKGLMALCAERPRVEEALLRAFAGGGLHAPIVEAVNDVLPDRPVRSARATPMRNMMAGGRASYETDQACRAASKG
jgi:hypothetical protein